VSAAPSRPRAGEVEPDPGHDHRPEEVRFLPDLAAALAAAGGQRRARRRAAMSRGWAAGWC
jgi:hypothetical protein